MEMRANGIRVELTEFEMSPRSQNQNTGRSFLPGKILSSMQNDVILHEKGPT